MDRHFTLGNHIKMWVFGLVALAALFAVACGAPAEQVPSDTGGAAQQAAQPTPELAKPQALDIPATPVPAVVAATPTAVPPPPEVVSSRDRLIFVTNEEPTTIGAASANCGGNIQNTICDDMVSDPLTWIDDFNDF